MVDRIGQQLGSYHLIRLLGRGSFAEVYLGEHVQLKTQAAIKVLHTSLEEGEVERFLHEAQTVARLKHPHIVRVFDFDVEGHTPFLVMDYLANGNMRRSYMKGTPLPLSTIAYYVKQVASALQYAHDQNLIHRDIKPENMLLDQSNQVVLSDFGIALMSQSSLYQSTQEVAGTAAYMAPEQFEGKARRASDQYALGIVVYEWLSGDRPFQGSFAEIASQHMFVPPPPLREKIPALSPLVEQVVLTALAKDPQRRFASVQAFSTALEQACQSAPILPVTSPTEVSQASQHLLTPGISSETSTRDLRLTHNLPSTQRAIDSGNGDGIRRNFTRRRLMTAILCIVLVAASIGSLPFLLPLFFSAAKTPQITPPPGGGSLTLLASPNSFTNGCFSCVVTLSVAQNSQGSLQWSASSTGISGIIFTPSSGTLTGGQTVQVTVSVPNTTCPANATFIFSGQATSVSVPWTCAAPTVPSWSVSPSSLNINNCSGASIWTCTVTLQELGNSQGSISWSAKSNSGAVFNPAGGNLSPGQQVTVSISSIPCRNDTFDFSGSGGASLLTVSWSCTPTPTPTPPKLSVSPSSLNANRDCSFSGVWTCSEKLSVDQGSLNWSASSAGISGITFSPSNGTLTPGQTVQVTVSVPNVTCPANATLTFAGQATSVSAPWTCTLTPTQILTSNVEQLDNTSSYCTYNGTTYSCTVTLTETAASTGNLQWTSSSSLSGVNFNPGSGTLSPGQTVPVIISNIPCSNGTFTFSGGMSPVTILWFCPSPG